MTGRFHHRWDVKCVACGESVVADLRRIRCAACVSGETQDRKADRQRMAERAIAATSLSIAEALKRADGSTKDVLARTLAELGITRAA